MNIVFLRATVDYGHSFAATNKKTELLAKGLTACGNRVTIHNGIEGSTAVVADESYEKDGIGRIVTYKRTGRRILEPINNFARLYRELKALRDPDGHNVIIVGGGALFHLYEEYLMMAKLLGYKMVVLSQEWLPTLDKPLWSQRFLDRVSARYFGYGVDAILPISEYLIEKTRHFNKPFLKTPIMGEYDGEPDRNVVKKGFVYCGASEYERVIRLIVEGYDKYCEDCSHPQPLNMVIAGTKEKVTAIVNRYSHNQDIHFHSGVPYDKLYSMYREASALLIPLDPDYEQDKARFSQKIAEYTATGTPIITTPVGEIPHYFKAYESAIMTDFSPAGITSVMKWIDKNPLKASEIGIKGWEVGSIKFNYLPFGKRLHEFLKSI